VIHIALDSHHVTPEWLDDASAATKGVKSKNPASRAKYIRSKGQVWRRAKFWLEPLAGAKCWYCESPIGRFDNPVDHFRPKGAVKERADHPGYWWLAFEWSNYRYACGWCNSFRRSHRGPTSGGKHDHFPIKDEATRASKETDAIADEFPLLLDPIRPGDAEHLWLDLSGKPVASPMCGKNRDSLPHVRVDITIRLLHLDEEFLTERRKQLRRHVTELVEMTQLAIDRYADYGDPAAAEQVRLGTSQVRRLASPRSELSAVVRCALAELAGEFPFAGSIAPTSG
jgi:hypothetical protein